jgi:crotonobetainyl-CoA:carnitine CoA-transferase CaiB-like acyl-CoA transferase
VRQRRGQRHLPALLRSARPPFVSGLGMAKLDGSMADPHVVGREILVDLPDDDLGRLPMHNVIPRPSDTPGRLRRPAPSLGQHTAEILGKLGLDRAALDGLAGDGVIFLGGAR